MPTVPGTRSGPTTSPTQAPSATDLAIAVGIMEQKGRFSEEMPFLKDLKPGEYGNPAELYAAHRKHGATKEEAKERVKDNIRAGMGMDDEEVDEMLRESPQS